MERRRECKFEYEDDNWLSAIGYARSARVAREKTWHSRLQFAGEVVGGDVHSVT
jgi:hypothetical protein